jgi:hypothetical protein
VRQALGHVFKQCHKGDMQFRKNCWVGDQRYPGGAVKGSSRR